MVNKKATKWFVIGLIIGLVFGGVIGYIIVNNLHRNNSPFLGNFQIDEQTKTGVISFFNSTVDMDKINSYCQENRMNCLYYCRNINPNHEICQNIQVTSNRSFGR